MTWVGCLLLAGVVTALGVACYEFQPLFVAVIGAMAVIGIVMTIEGDGRLDRLAAERPGESICTFARSFDYRRVDTWIIRAVFEELQPWCRTRRGVLPLRRADDLGDVFGIVDEDVDLVIEEVAARAGRSLADCSANPLLGRVATVGDVVDFLMHQPALAR